MKKLCVLLLLSLPFVLQFCASSKKNRNAVAKTPPKLTYVANVQPMMVANCSPCHMPPKGLKKPYDTYVAVKEDIDPIISRIQKNPTDKGFMPFKHAKLPDSTIQVYVQWKIDGLLEK